jgi:ornithine carbamoyltransferase
MRNFIQITDFTTDELIHILDRADQLQRHWQNHTMPQTLNKERIALWFWGNGFRNRMAFEIGGRAMGADVSYIPGELGIQEPIEDIGHYLGNWFSMLIIRTKNHEALCSVAKDASIPTINARTTFNHPCEVMGDLQYIRGVRGSIEDLKVVFVGEVTNLCMSWFEAAVRFPISVLQVGPERYLLPETRLRDLNAGAIGEIATSNDLDRAISKQTELIYTDCWPQGLDSNEIKSIFLPYQITTDILDRINDKGLFLPCPPVTRGQEASQKSLVSEKCQDYQAKECLLHTQNAIMEFLIQEKNSAL